MANGIITDTHLTNIANAIRQKNGSTDTYKPSEMATAIINMPSGVSVTVSLLPNVSSSDNGKLLRVQNGEYVVL